MDEHRRVPATRVGWRMVPGASVALVIIVLVALRRAEVPRIVGALRAARPIALGMGAGLSILWLCAYASMHAASQRLGGVRPSATRSLRLGVSSMMWNHITKSGGLAGAAPFVREGRRSGTPPGMVLAGYMFAMVVGEVAFASTLAIAFVVMAKHGSLTALEVGAARSVELSLSAVAQEPNCVHAVTAPLHLLLNSFDTLASVFETLYEASVAASFGEPA